MIASEKQSQALLALLTTPVGDWHILLSKALGVFKRALAAWLLASADLLLCGMVGSLSWRQVGASFLVAAYLSVFVTGLGLYLSSRFHTPAWALATLIGILSLFWIILPCLPLDAFLGRFGLDMTAGSPIQFPRSCDSPVPASIR